MIGYVTLGTNDFDKAAAFYDQLLGVIGAKRVMEFENAYIAWGTGPDKPMLSILHPYNKEPATIGNGVMIALAVDSKDQVDALYAKAIELGGQDEGPAGPRSDGFYAGYFRDTDGNKLNAYCMV